jgi:eukaryotic-like serine/threonine-protein kinase
MSEEPRDLRDHDRLDDALKAAFQEPAGGVLDAIERISGTRSRVLLRDAPEDGSPVLGLTGLSEEGAFADDGRYQVLGEIGRGGMGTVYKGRDRDLGRDVALKVLRADLAEIPAVVQRFVEEAQVGGQLQHPGIVPIYGLALGKGGRPYFAMKLVKGETLSSLLEGGAKASALVGVFERVAQTIAYAHSRGVIHRDLKPANVMVGAFGEVQVLDWGFAKILGREEKPRPGVTMLATVRTGAEGSHSVAGSVMGTPAYMPPEQAMGLVESLTERSDVFALGAILCEILTRKPPYTGTMQDQLLAAMHARLEEAHARLAACVAPEALVSLARDCLEPLPKDRPKDAGVVAQRIADHLASVEERARQAELDAVHAASEARRAQRGRRTTLALATVALVAIVGGGGGFYAWKASERARASAAAEKVAPLLLEATRGEGERDWATAQGSATTALALAQAEGADAETLATVRALHARIGAGAAAAKARAEKLARETRLLDDLDESRTQRTDPSEQEVERGFREAFSGFGVDPDGEGAAAALAGFGRKVELAVHLDRWARARFRQGDERWRALDRLARVLDDDPWRMRLRDTARAGDAAALRGLAAEVDPAEQHPATLWWLGDSLSKAGDAEAAAAFLRRSLLLYPADSFLHHKLAQVLWWGLRRAPESIAHAQAALALRPESAAAWNTVGVVRNDGLRDPDGGIRALRRAVELQPRTAAYHSNLGYALRGKGELVACVAACREAIRLDPGHVPAYDNLGLALQDTGDLDGAVAALREGIRVDPNYARIHNSLGCALDDKGDTDAAIAEYREAVRLDPKAADWHHNLGLGLQDKDDFAGAVAEYREAVRLDPKSYWGWVNMSVLLCDRLGRYDEAIAACREAIRIDPKVAQAHINLGVAHLKKGDVDGAIAVFRGAVRTAPNVAELHDRLGKALARKGYADGAAAAHLEAIRIDANNAGAYVNRGAVLSDQLGRHAEAVDCFRQAIRIQPKLVPAHANLGTVLLNSGDFEGAVEALRAAQALDPKNPGLDRLLAIAARFEKARARLPAVLRGEARPGDAAEWLVFAEVAYLVRDYASSVRLHQDAFAADPRVQTDLRAAHRYRAARAAALAGPASHTQALAWLRAELDAWEQAPAAAEAEVARALRHWKANPDLATVRDGANLSDAWRAFWARVDELLAWVEEDSK